MYALSTGIIADDL